MRKALKVGGKYPSGIHSPTEQFNDETDFSKVSESHFKALVFLLPGPNKLRFDFSSPKLANSNSSNPIHSSYLTIHMMPPLATPPLQLVILLGKDSPGTFDAVPARVEKEGNGLETAIKKFRMAAYLWQAFTAEQMFRNKLGRRVFRMEEEWITGTSNYRDRETQTMRSEAKIHIVRSSKTVAELRDPDLAQQNPKAERAGDLFGIASEAVRDFFKPLPGQKQYVSVLLLDAHWDNQAKLITGHAALGGGGGEIQLAIFGSQVRNPSSSLLRFLSLLWTRWPCGSSCQITSQYVGGHISGERKLTPYFRLYRVIRPLSRKSSRRSLIARLPTLIMLQMIATSLAVAGKLQTLALGHTCTKPAIYLGAHTKRVELCSVTMSPSIDHSPFESHTQRGQNQKAV